MRYPADPILIKSRLRGSSRMLAFAIFLIVAAACAAAIFGFLGRLDVFMGVLLGILVLVAALLLVRTVRTRSRMLANVGFEFAVTDEGLTLFQTGTIPWRIITHVSVIDASHQLTQLRAGMATQAGFGVYSLNLMITDAEATRARHGKAVTVGPHDRGIVSVELDSVIGLDVAREAIAQTVAAAGARQIPVATHTSGVESFSFTLDYLGEVDKNLDETDKPAAGSGPPSR